VRKEKAEVALSNSPPPVVIETIPMSIGQRMAERRINAIKTKAPQNTNIKIVKNDSRGVVLNNNRSLFQKVQPISNIQSNETDHQSRNQRSNSQIGIVSKPRSYHQARNRTQSDINIINNQSLIKPPTQSTHANNKRLSLHRVNNPGQPDNIEQEKNDRIMAIKLQLLELRQERSQKTSANRKIHLTDAKLLSQVRQESDLQEENNQFIISPTQELKTEKPEEKKPEPKSSQKKCVVCMDAPTDAIIILCGHLAMCMKDAKQLKNCPICRISYSPDQVIKVYQSGIENDD